MTFELPEQLEVAVKVEATVRGMSPYMYVCEVLERDLGGKIQPAYTQPYKSGLGMWSQYGISLSEEDIDENRADMLRNSVFAVDAE